MSSSVPQRRAKNGAQVKHYDNPDVVKNFDAIRVALQEQNPADASSFANKQLAQLTADLIKFMDATLGRQVSVFRIFTRFINLYRNGLLPIFTFLQSERPRPYTKLPIRLFQDHSADGSLFIILSTVHAFKAAQGWRRCVGFFCLRFFSLDLPFLI